MKQKRVKRILTVIAAFAGVLIATALVALVVLQARTRAILDDYTSIYQDEKYQTPVMIEGVPVPFEWAALCDGEWTLHYSLIIGANIPGDRITVANPYGYYEEITVAELLRRTSFEAYAKMPLFLKLGFAFGIFEKNTVFRVQRHD